MLLGIGGDVLEEIGATHQSLTAERSSPIFPDGPAAAWYRRSVSAAAVASMIGWHVSVRRPTPAPSLTGRALDDSPIVRSWSGPWNIHGLMNALPSPGRATLAALLDPPGPGHARLVALAHAIDGTAGFAGVLTRARWATGLTFDEADARQFLDLMRAAGWVRITD